MSGMREKDSADFDLEAFIDLFDEALTSDDPAVQKTLQHLMVIAALARNHDGHSERRGPLRRMYEDLQHINRRLERLETGNSTFGKPNTGWPGGGYNPSAPYGPVPVPNTGPGMHPYTPLNTFPLGGGSGGPAYPQPNPIWTTTTGATSISLAKDSAIAGKNIMASVAERVENLLKDEKYKGSSVGTVDVKIS